ncbi:MAG: guanylate kinase [Bacteroidota bacterium]
MHGKMVIFSAPSGAGKTTIVHQVMEQCNDLSFSVSATTRNPRSGEKDGEDYYFLTTDEFKQKIEEGEFIEYEQVYHKQFYGTLRTEVERLWNDGKHVVFDVDVVGGLNIKKQYKTKALAIFIMPPSLDVLEQRLYKRAKDDERSIRLRLSKARQELTYAHQFDQVVVNEILEEAVEETKTLIQNFLNHDSCQ